MKQAGTTLWTRSVISNNGVGSPLELNSSVFRGGTNQKYLSDYLVAVTWEVNAAGGMPVVRAEDWAQVGAWQLAETSFKTGHRITMSLDPLQLRQTVHCTVGCARCKDAVYGILRHAPRAMPATFDSRARCLNQWKRSMRGSLPRQVVWPPFHQTLLLIKPRVAKELGQAITTHLESEYRLRVTGRRRVTLSHEDVRYLYSTAYGQPFLRRQREYYDGARCTILLIEGEDIVNRQNDLKKNLRTRFGAAVGLENLVHVPDSLAESYANIAWFFGEDVLLESISDVL